MTAQRTPPPYRADGGNVFDANGNVLVAVCVRGAEREIADAEFIARACSSHDALVASLKAFLPPQIVGYGSGIDTTRYESCVRHARAALAKAGAA